MHQTVQQLKDENEVQKKEQGVLQDVQTRKKHIKTVIF
jgi:hypothetical protein